MHGMSAGEVRGRSVVDRVGVQLGEVQDVMFDADEWRVTGLRVNLRRDVASRLQVGHGFLGSPSVTFGADRIAAVGDTIILNLDADGIGAIVRG